MNLNFHPSNMTSSHSTPITSVSRFLEWRRAVVDDELNFKALQRKPLDESTESFEKNGRSKTELMEEVMKDEKALLQEKAILLSQHKSFEGDLNDVDTSKTQLAAAYITELRISLEIASSTKEKVPGMKAERLDRSKFTEIVHKYLGTEKRKPGTTAKFCNVLGDWLHGGEIRCAHIVPFSFHTKEMSHMFGSDEPPLTSQRNGLSLHSKIEEAFDNCWVAIVPLDSVASTPTEWKVVVLNPAIKNNVFFVEDPPLFNRIKYWRWRDIDGRKLTFLNDNRPARRFLYTRYTLAWLHAEANNWVGFKDKVPPAEVWASPNKPEGYLRKSILLEVGKMTRDRLPRDLIDAGGFEASDTSNAVYDTIAAIRVAETMQRHLDGDRDPKKGEDSDESEDEDDEGGEGEEND